MKKIVMTGGGTAGHVTPNIALFDSLQKDGYEIHYIGSYEGIEKGLIEDKKIPYYGISSGKFRRYRSWKNLTDPFRVLHGFFQARRLLGRIRPNVVFSKGGFVSVPVVMAAKTRHIPVIIHESDLTPGLANKLAMPSATKVCCNFPETLPYLPKEKAVLTGSPIRQELLHGNKQAAKDFCGFTDDLPILMVMGGSIGSVYINNAIRGCIDTLLTKYQIIHLCGKGNIDESLKDKKGYAQFEYISENLPDLFAAADLVVARAGANSICELLALHKPNILIPLSRNASRGDQILNANSFAKQGFSAVLEEEEVTSEKLMATIDDVMAHRSKYIDAMKNSGQMNAIETIMGLIEEVSR
ncbi:undecaprenyldiphospho-muramoylpentapeptide beta-N-acetylglucosaminyltransferase [Roseburia sp. AM51-8]|uniref:undecaprenyldiphospho-muramoylpentapeptide beta-N-acetylglucosaminyltransferase n=1 Tax=Roseburia sp. AM51-8 TaxID=2292366 RepID=UPI000E490118|nr:undecaprenyldiphospho-muramoylpentapeptide beta-N-acetylglucosaminyltransferase [Roseburia sp. AM51-8]RHQ01159.1 undecaprenyldiphospho-muramoylpentapeptide beta-N-acetylglucosaminyltransferase [Roseburia sp. AM51-8]